MLPDEAVEAAIACGITDMCFTEHIDRIKCDKIELVSSKDNSIVCRFDHHKYTASEGIGEVSKELSIVDLTVEEPDIEEAVARIYHAE